MIFPSSYDLQWDDQVSWSEGRGEDSLLEERKGVRNEFRLVTEPSSLYSVRTGPLTGTLFCHTPQKTSLG